MKTCTKCNQQKSYDNFAKTIISKKTGEQLYRNQCKLCKSRAGGKRYLERYHSDPALRAKHLADNARDPLARKLRDWHNKYGIDPVTARAYYIAHDGKCEICNLPCSTGKDLALDHCHETNKIRGMLCSKCNKALGLLGDDLEGVLRAVRYLQKR